MAMRVTGMMSGMDTESIIQQLVEARRVKVDTLKKKQTSMGWKQEAWKELNNKIYKLYNGAVSNLKYQSSFTKKTTAVSNSNLVSVITDDSAMDSVQNLKINRLATAGYMTGAKLQGKDGGKLTSGSKVVDSLGIESGSKFEIETKGKKTEISIDENTTVNSLVSQLKAAGVNANFDAEQQRLFIGATETGESADFALTAANAKGTDALNKLGILTYDETTLKAYQKYAALGAGTPESEAAKKALIDSRVETRRAAYVKERDALKKSNEKLTEKEQKLLEEYKFDSKFKLDGSDADSRKDRMDVINARLEELAAKEKQDGVTLSEDEIKERNELTSELSYIKGYDELEASKAENDKKIADITDHYVAEDGSLVTYTKDDGTAGGLVAEETAAVDAKIAEAQNLNITVDADGKLTTNATGSDAKKQVGQSSEIELNGVKYTSDSNTIKVNGLTITCNGTTAKDETVTLTTKNDTSGIYDMVKNFIKEYSALINEMDKLYNADSAKGYEPLTDDEKEAMSDSEVEKWESKIKDSLLRRDSTLNTVASAMKEIMASGFEVNGKTMYLYDFGIDTLGYFNAAENEKNAYHINGDEDDEAVKNNTNTLMAMINSDPDAVASFFSQLTQKMSDKLFGMMGTTQFSSFNKVYDDKRMKEEYDSYTTKISEAEKKLQDYEDKWYKKFSQMETAMAKMQSNVNAVTSLLGG